jgi:hypothetical protein
MVRSGQLKGKIIFSSKFSIKKMNNLQLALIFFIIQYIFNLDKDI